MIVFFGKRDFEPYAKLGIPPMACFALYPLMNYIEMAPLFQYGFVVGCLTNNMYMIAMESNLMGIANKTGFKSQQELQMELVKGTSQTIAIT